MPPSDPAPAAVPMETVSLDPSEHVWEERVCVDIAGKTPPCSPTGVESSMSTQSTDYSDDEREAAPEDGLENGISPSDPPAFHLGCQGRPRHRTMTEAEAKPTGGETAAELPPAPADIGSRMRDEEREFLAAHAARLAAGAEEIPRCAPPEPPQGAVVVAHGLKHAGLNGMRGTLTGKRQGVRYGVSFPFPWGEKALLPENLRIVTADDDEAFAAAAAVESPPRKRDLGCDDPRAHQAVSQMPDPATTTLSPGTFDECFGALQKVLGTYGDQPVTSP
eukprot:TRINITY_DN11464_c0_g1_i1.p1 TRINITY_DN11464_c0_g1~~TRINITY_DN11464_c0_g1_i1.p1  ORF type:complete len:277 (+),score=77.81 TRINITY_DN11464_c0_g1_i1:57-887(+)